MFIRGISRDLEALLTPPIPARLRVDATPEALLFDMSPVGVIVVEPDE